MPVLQRILVALDGSGAAQRALSLALELSRQYDGELLFCTALDHTAAGASVPDGVYPSTDIVPPEYDETARTLLRDATSLARAAGARSTTMLLEGRAADAVLACARQHNVDAIVMGTQGKRGLDRLFLGSTAEDVLREADVPTFVVRDADDGAGHASETPKAASIERILVALDDSDQAEAALLFALGLVAPGKGMLLCCSVIETGQLIDNAAIYGCDPVPLINTARDAADALIEAQVGAALPGAISIQRIVLEGDPVDALLDAASERRADLIVCGTHGRHGIRRLLVGSVAESLILGSLVPVAVVGKVGIGAR
jgi:nucleotide-binding universal stress UspA family protein